MEVVGGVLRGTQTVRVERGAVEGCGAGPKKRIELRSLLFAKFLAS